MHAPDGRCRVAVEALDELRQARLPLGFPRAAAVALPAPLHEELRLAARREPPLPG